LRMPRIESGASG